MVPCLIVRAVCLARLLADNANLELLEHGLEVDRLGLERLLKFLRTFPACILHFLFGRPGLLGSKHARVVLHFLSIALLGVGDLLNYAARLVLLSC